MSLAEELNTTPSALTRAAIITRLWPRPATTRLQMDDLDWNPYFTYYFQECVQALHNKGVYISARTHQDIISIAARIEKLDGKDNIKNASQPQLTKPRPADQVEKMVEGSINLAARLLVMMDIGTLPLAFSGRLHIAWDKDSLQECVRKYFDVSSTRSPDSVKLDKAFTARNLGRIGGIAVEWTNNLADHLRLVDDDKKVRFFYHATFLKWQQSQIFPAGLVEETLNTIALLLPQSDAQTQKWLKSLMTSSKEPVHLDRELLKCGSLRAEKRQLDEFHFWRDRLVILKQVFDQSRPKTISQWWHDRRNSVQWYTFWVALIVLALTIFFGVVQSIEGALQVYKAYYPTIT